MITSYKVDREKDKTFGDALFTDKHPLPNSNYIIPQESEFIQRLDKISPRLADETRANALNKDLKEAKARFNLKNTDKENAKLFNKVIVVAQQLGVKFESKGKSLLGELGHYNPSTNTAKVFTKGEKEAETILHELIHSVTTRALHTNSKHLTPLQNEAVKEIKTIFQTLSKDKAFKETYALSSVDEMLAELSNKAFRTLLKGKNLLQRMYNAIAKLIFKRQNNYDKLENALYKLMDNYGDNGNSRINGKILNSMGLEKDFLKNDKVDLNALKKEAVQLPKAFNETEFKAQFKAIKGTKADVKTPIGNVSVDINAAWKHLTENTYNKDRREFSGAFLDTLTSPLFIVKQKYRTQSVRTTRQFPQGYQNTKHSNGSDGKRKNIIQDSYVFYKPFNDDKGVYHLASFAVDTKGNLLHKTFYDLQNNINKLKQLIKATDSNLLYYKNAVQYKLDSKAFDLKEVDISTTEKLKYYADLVGIKLSDTRAVIAKEFLKTRLKQLVC